MIYGKNDYGSIPAIVRDHINGVSEHEHTPKKHDSVLDTLKHDHGLTAVNLAKKVLKGAALGFVIGFTSYFFKEADKKLLTDRVRFQWSTYLVRRCKVNVVTGALAGAGWWLLYDQLLCPHGDVTFHKHLLAYSIGGSVLFATLWSPTSFVVGGVLGCLMGFKDEIHYMKELPKDMEIQFGKVNEAARRRAIHDEFELSLSQKLRLAQTSLVHRYSI